MHLPSLLCLFTSALRLFSTSFAAPLKNVHHPSRTTIDNVDKRQLQVLVDVASIINAAENVVNAIEAIINTIDGDDQEAEGQFTQNLVSTLRGDYPTMNVLVFHNQNCIYDLYGATHAHYELDLGLGFTQGYEVWVFDYGTFELVGDGGYENWAFGGNYDVNGNDVTFYTIDGN